LDEKRKKEIQKRASYANWTDLLKWLKTKPTQREILYKLHETIDSRSGYHSAYNSECSKESLDLVLEENKVR
jgi:hypothetical protein